MIKIIIDIINNIIANIIAGKIMEPFSKPLNNVVDAQSTSVDAQKGDDRIVREDVDVKTLNGGKGGIVREDVDVNRWFSRD